MKKIKRKDKSPGSRRPAFVVGHVGESPPAGFLAAWFNQAYGGPLHTRFQNAHSNAILEASHLDWKADIRFESPPDEVAQWQEQIGWAHTGVIQVFSTSRIGVSRMDAVLFVARLIRGLTLLTAGTAYDLGAGLYWNPSDWSDRSLAQFCIDDHVSVHQEESLPDGRQWFVTRGMGKLGLEELEVFRPRGVSELPTKERLMDLAHLCALQGKSPKVGDLLHLPVHNFSVPVVKHRTISIANRQINVREVSWD